ncbi:MAG TPA: hypothetical protein VE869_15935 [Gemmatimonas sp.]|nr:hypothetical protein [Gemmatimonas sp.]
MSRPSSLAHSASRSAIRLRASLVALPLLAALFTSQADAQVRRRGSPPPQQRRERPSFSIDAGGLFSSLRGNALGNVGDGTGFDVMGSIGANVFSLGVGYQRTWHSRPGNEDDVIVDGGFIEPRLALPFATGNFTPYVLGRASRLTRRPPDSGVGSDEPTVNGTALGLGAGTLFWLASNVQLNTAIMWQDLRFDRAQGLTTSVGSVSRATGSQWALRAGLTIGFDEWGR